MINSAQFTIASTPVKISSTSQTPRIINLHMTNGSVFIGATNTVSAATGFFYEKAAGIFTVQMDSDDELWAMTDSGTHTLTVLERYL
jgi:hypothetical protein